MSPQEELQRLLYATLTASDAVMSLVSGLYDRIPKDPFGAKMAYLSFGPSDVSDQSGDCTISGEFGQQIDCWSRKPDLDISCRQIVDAVRKALRPKLELSENALVSLSVSFAQVLRDPDGLTSHGVIRVRALIEEAE